MANFDIDDLIHSLEARPERAGSDRRGESHLAKRSLFGSRGEQRGHEVVVRVRTERFRRHFRQLVEML
jgi:hypothetical protein